MTVRTINLPLNIAEYETRARAILPEAVFWYYAGGAGDEDALKANRAAFLAIRLRPRVLIPVEHVSTSLPASVLSKALRSTGNPNKPIQLAMPVIIAPMAMQRLADSEHGELATARATRASGLAMCLSTLATKSIEDIACTECPRLFQLYLLRDRQKVLNLVRRARVAGYAAIVLTVDAPRFGRRERDLKTDFNLPSHMTLANFTEFSRATKLGEPSSEEISPLQKFGDELIDPNLTWTDLSWLVREAKPMPVWVKGIVRADDAELAVKHGAAAIIVSNHGARQLDTVVATMTALPEVVEAVQGRIPVLLDSGIRRGDDILKALALGASCVLIGRPVLWGLATSGQAGVKHVLSLLQRELALSMALLGTRDYSEISPDRITNGSSCTLRTFRHDRSAKL